MPENAASVFVSGCGMMIVAAIASLFWWRFSQVQVRWFWVGAGLWTIAAFPKVVCTIVTDIYVVGSLEGLPHPLFVALGGLCFGAHSCFFELGVTLLAVVIWRQLGRDATRAITIGLGAGVFEAFLLGFFAVMGGIAMTFVQGPEMEKGLEELRATASVTPLLWLVGTVERTIAILCHASSRALVLLGVTKQKYILVFWGFLLFTLVDGIVGAVQIGGLTGKISGWWVELAILPFALVSIPILVWCYRRWGEQDDEGRTSSEGDLAGGDLHEE